MQNFFIFFIFSSLCSVSLRKNGGKKNLFIFLVRCLLILTFFCLLCWLVAGCLLILSAFSVGLAV